jgi:hypothetical protein
MTYRLAESLVTLRRQVNQAYPHRNKASDGWIGDPNHQAEGTGSDHNPNKHGVVCALDITHDPANGVDIDKLSDYLADSGDPRIKYLIANGEAIEPAKFGWIWQPYEGDNPHTSHLHVSVYGDYDNPSEWNIGKKEGEYMTDENFVRAFYIDLFEVSPTKEQMAQYIGRNVFEVYNELRSSKAHADLVKFNKQVRIDAVERAKAIQKLQEDVAKLPTGDAQKRLEEVKAKVEELAKLVK